MKKHVFLTSLFAIGIACSAHAAKTDSNVTFGGKFTYEGTEYTVGDEADATTYEYDLPNGNHVDGVVYTEAPDLSGFSFDFMGDTTKDYDPENPLSAEDFTLPDTVETSGSDTVTYNGKTLIAGGSVSESDYTITVNEKEYNYADGRPEAKGEVTLNSEYTDQTIVVENGAAIEGIDIEKYSWTDPKTNITFGLAEQEGEIVPVMGDAVVGVNGEGLQNFINAYKADVEAVATMEQATSEEGMAAIYAAFDEADDIFESDKAILETLDNLYAGYQKSDSAYKTALDAQKTATEQYATNNQSFQDAQDLYNSSIMGTIGEAIDASLEDVNATLAEKASVEDVEANTANIATNTQAIADNKTAIESETSRAETAESELSTKIETNTTAIAANKTAIESEVARATAAEEALSGRIDVNASDIAANKTAIETNATNIAANKQAIATETAERKAADEQLAKDIKAGDEMTLAAAKAYADTKNEAALKSANNYTDKKVNALEKELSAGIASTAAMSSIEVSNVGKGEVSVGGGYGYYNSQSAVAFGAAMGLTDNWSINAAAGLADSNVSFRAGTNYKFKLFK